MAPNWKLGRIQKYQELTQRPEVRVVYKSDVNGHIAVLCKEAEGHSKVIVAAVGNPKRQS